MEPKKKKVAKPAKKSVSKKAVAKKAPTKKKLNKKTDPLIQQLASRIKSIRKSQGHTNADFFAYSNEISRSQYARYENGEDIRFSSLMKLIDAFGMTAEEFFSEGFE